MAGSSRESKRKSQPEEAKPNRKRIKRRGRQPKSRAVANVNKNREISELDNESDINLNFETEFSENNNAQVEDY